jgi:long-chain acyl-CoA synthetase
MILPPPKTFSSLPLYHAYGMTCSVLAGLVGGLGVCINGNLKTMMRDMAAFKPGSIVVVPLLAESIHKMIWAEIDKAGQRKAVSSLLKRYRILGRPDFLRRRLQKLVRVRQFENLRCCFAAGLIFQKRLR